MRSKAPLAMMEQVVMLLVFALAAALCLQAFVKSDALSKRSEARDRAAVLCQNAAEAVQSTGGSTAAASALLDAVYPYGFTQMPLEICYDGGWARSDGDGAAYRLLVMPVDSGVPGLGKAHISVTREDTGEVLFELDAAWQEVSAHG